MPDSVTSRPAAVRRLQEPSRIYGRCGRLRNRGTDSCITGQLHVVLAGRNVLPLEAPIARHARQRGKRGSAKKQIHPFFLAVRRTQRQKKLRRINPAVALAFQPQPPANRCARSAAPAVALQRYSTQSAIAAPSWAPAHCPPTPESCKPPALHRGSRSSHPCASPRHSTSC